MPKKKTEPRYESKYPGYSPEAYAEMIRRHSGPIPKSRHDQAIKLYADGKTRDEVCTALGCSNSALQISLTYDDDFKRRWGEVTRSRKRRIGDGIIETLLCGSVEIRTTKLPKKDDNGKIVRKPNGDPVMEIAKEEIIEKPASADLLKIWIDLNSDKGNDSDRLPTDQILERINELRQQRSDYKLIGNNANAG